MQPPASWQPTERWSIDRGTGSIQLAGTPGSSRCLRACRRAWRHGLLLGSGRLRRGDRHCGDRRRQTRQALNNLAVVLAGVGSSLDRVVRASVFLRDAGMFAEMDAVFAEVFGTARPARTTLPGLQFREGVDVEIDLIAAI